MQKIKYYCEFKTWAEGNIECSWPLAKFEELPEYRLRADKSVIASTKKVQNIFMSMDPSICTKFLKDYIAALVLGIIIECTDNTDLKDMLFKIFGYCEILGCVEVTTENQLHIQQIMDEARIDTAPSADI